MTTDPTDRRSVIALQYAKALWDDDNVGMEAVTIYHHDFADAVIAALDASAPTESVIARATVCVPREALDVLLIAADWAEARLEVRENPLRLALINIRAALDASASAGDALTVREAEALLDAVELKTVGVVVRNETMAEARARHDALLSARDKLRALVERSRT